MDKGSILIIDDEIGPRESLRMLFKDDYKVFPAYSGQEGIEILKNNTVEIVILDLKMPGMSGIETLEKIREIDEKIPVIILTGYGTMDTAKRAIHLGAVEFLSKPFDINAMVQIVSGAVNKRKLFLESERLSEDLLSLNDNLQGKLKRMENLVAVGEMSSEILHEINNTLTVVKGYTELLLEELSHASPEDSTSKGYLGTIEKEIKRCQSIAKSIRDLAHSDFESVEVNVKDLLGNIIVFFRDSNFGKNVKFKTVLPDEIPTIQGDSNQLHQVFVNLIINAIEAVGHDGKVEIEAGEKDGKVEVIVRDNGTGIPEDVLPKIFDAFFTSKKGKGTGIGLAIAKRIIEKHGGEIIVESTREKGTCFTISLPAFPTKS